MKFLIPRDQIFPLSVPDRVDISTIELNGLKKKSPQIGDVDGLGLALRIEICQKDGQTPDRELTDKDMNIGLEREINCRSCLNRTPVAFEHPGHYFKNVRVEFSAIFVYNTSGRR